MASAELAEARGLLAAEWLTRSPQSPADIREFYRVSSQLAGDLHAWHNTPERQLMTDMLVHVATQAGSGKGILDVGCGTGHDLGALRAAGFEQLMGVEPNDNLREMLLSEGFYVQPTLLAIDVPKADLIVCVDVLEHVNNPEGFLSIIAENAKLGTLLFEATATHDHETPLHLKANRGWHPGRCLERNGWWLVDTAEAADRVRVWERRAFQDTQHASLLACVYRSIGTSTHNAILSLLQGNSGWRERLLAGDGLIARSRSRITSSWWAETNDDVFLMVDDDVAFTAEDAEHLVDLVRDGKDIVCGAYPVHNGAHFAIKMLPGQQNETIAFGAGEPIEIRYAATGFMAVHRRVIDALVPTLPMCEPWSFLPFFQAMVVEDEVTGDHTLLSEDWGFCEMARRLGFRVWLDPRAILGHESSIPVSVRNMHIIQAAVQANQATTQEGSPNGRA
jgi:SAM-dependent methyltransferase